MNQSAKVQEELERVRTRKTQQQPSEAENVLGLDLTVQRLEAFTTRPRLAEGGIKPPRHLFQVKKSYFCKSLNCKPMPVFKSVVTVSLHRNKNPD